jgi:hypothetical protein
MGNDNLSLQIDQMISNQENLFVPMIYSSWIFVGARAIGHAQVAICVAKQYCAAETFSDIGLMVHL